MRTLGRVEWLYVATGFGLQGSLVAYFALRTWAFDAALQVGWVIYALALPALAVSAVLVRAGRPWFLWVAGVAYGLWAAFGYAVDVAKPVDWRSQVLWPVFLPYVALYLFAQVFYWWPLGQFDRRLWLAYTVLFVVSTSVNIASHG
jgi:hypothetical protein